MSHLLPAAALPASIRVAAFDFKVEEWHPMGSASARRYGEFSSMEGVIRIDPQAGRIKTLDTVIHELLHAVYWSYNIAGSDDEERTVATMSTGLTQVLRDNPDLRRFIEESLQEPTA
jgi:hypothetical protein